MNCPVCQVDLAITDRQGIEIDYCPKCRGIWLDRGELDKIIERSTPALADSRPPHKQASGDRGPSVGDGGDYSKHSSYGKKKSNWLGELFDFG
jgi:Zn-finger nucleic acid-binding protein